MIKVPKRKKVIRRPKFADEQWTGSEPVDNVVVNCSTDSVLANALNWYNYYYELDKAKQWIIEYMEKSTEYSSNDIKKLKSAPSPRTSSTTGWLCRLLLKGWTFPESTKDFISSRIQETIDAGTDVTSTSTSPEIISPRQRTQDRARLLKGMVDDNVDRLIEDDTFTFSCYDFLRVENASPIACDMIRQYAINYVQELIECRDEGYEHFSNTTHKRWIKYFESIIEDCDKFSSNKKTTRKPRKPREKDSTKLVRKLKYLKESVTDKLVSVSPEEIIKAKSLWIYNTKYKQLTVYHALDHDGLSVKGTSISNFSPEKSVTKKLRKPELILDKVLNTNKIDLRMLMDNVATQAKLATGRINENTILLRVIK